MKREKEHVNYEKELPAGYREIYSIDAKDSKVGVLMNIAALALSAIIIVIGWFAIRPTDFFGSYSILRNVLFIVVCFGYVILHELVHGAAYKALTGQKLTFGISMTVAYCGVPQIYVYRRAALISLLAPFVVFNIVFLVPVFLFTNAWDKFYCLVLFALHFGGCAGDLYDTLLYLFRFRSPKILMRDTGPKQTFYSKD